MKENIIEKTVCEYAKKNDWLVYKFSSPSNKGVPDRIFIKEGLILFIEFKASKAKPTKLQQKVINHLKDENCNVFVIDNIDKGKKLFDDCQRNIMKVKMEQMEQMEQDLNKITIVFE